MKFNWGHGIFLGIIFFMSFILFMVFKANTQSFSLTSKDYYMKELSYQNQIDAKKNVQKLSDTLNIIQTIKEIVIHYPYPFKKEGSQKIKGQILFYRPNGMELDKVYPIETDKDNYQYFLKSDLLGGRYILKISWEIDGNPYYVEQNLNINK